MATSNTAPQPTQRAAQIANELRAAAERAEAGAARLNRRSKSCGSCGRRDFEDFREANAAEAVYGIIKKLRRWATALEHPEMYTVRGSRRDDFDEDEDSGPKGGG